MTDRELLKEYLDTNSQDAFARIVAMHVDMVHTAATRMVRRGGGAAHLAEDVTQAVFILLAKRVRELDANVALAGWLYEATRLSASVAMRAQRRRQRHEAAAAVEAQHMRAQVDPSSLSDASATWQQMEPLIDDAMGKLSSADRNAIALRFFQNKSMAEAGQALGITEDAAKIRVSRAVGRLRKLLAGAGVTAPVPTVMTAMLLAGSKAAPVGLGQSAATAALAGSAAAGGKLGISYTIAKEANAMITWIKIKFALTVAMVVLVVGTGAAVIGQTLLKPPPSPQPIVGSPATPVPAVVQPSPDQQASVATVDGATAPAVTVHTNAVDPRKAVDALALASGAKLEIWPDSAWDPQFMGFGQAMPKVTLNADNQPFWFVFLDLCKQAKARPQEMGNDRAMITVAVDNNGSFMNQPMFVGTSHLVIFTMLSRNNNVSFEQDRTVRETRGGALDVWVDPRVNVVKSSHTVWVDLAVDENGTSLVVPHDNTMDNFWQGGFTPWHLSLNFPLNYDWTKSKTLKRLSGHVRIVVPSKTATIEFPDLLSAKGTEKSAGGVRMVINDVQDRQGQLEYRATIYRGSNLSNDRWKDIKEQTNQGILISDANGRRLGLGGGANGGDQQAEVGLIMSFQPNDLKTPIKLVWQVALETRSVDLPFEFSDLPLP